MAGLGFPSSGAFLGDKLRRRGVSTGPFTSSFFTQADDAPLPCSTPPTCEAKSLASGT